MLTLLQRATENFKEGKTKPGRTKKQKTKKKAGNSIMYDCDFYIPTFSLTSSAPYSG